MVELSLNPFSLTNNFHTPNGEIDLIISDDDEVIFVEVKTRKNTSYEFGEESVSTKKVTFSVV